MRSTSGRCARRWVRTRRRNEGRRTAGTALQDANPRHSAWEGYGGAFQVAGGPNTWEIRNFALHTRLHRRVAAVGVGSHSVAGKRGSSALHRAPRVDAHVEHRRRVPCRLIHGGYDVLAAHDTPPAVISVARGSAFAAFFFGTRSPTKESRGRRRIESGSRGRRSSIGLNRLPSKAS